MDDIDAISEKVESEWSIDIIAAKLLVNQTLKLVSDLHPEIVLQLMERIGKEQRKKKDGVLKKIKT